MDDFKVFITNLGKYNEGYLLGEWVTLPTTRDELKYSSVSGLVVRTNSVRLTRSGSSPTTRCRPACLMCTISLVNMKISTC